MSEEVEALKAQVISLRARVAVAERVAWLGAELAAMLRPEQSLGFLTEQRQIIAASLSAPDVDDPLSVEDRRKVAAEVEVRFGELVKAVREAARTD